MPLSLRNLLHDTAAMFRPTFNGLAAVVMLYVVFALLVFPHSNVLSGDLPDTDDYMYLDQIMDWLNGQGWYDNIQHRMDPPAGVPIHFSRLAMMPMAALVWIFERCGLPPVGAGTIMAMIYPLILMGLFFAALRWVVKNFVPTEWAGASAFVVLFLPGTLFMFRPGHIDHHGLMALMLMVAMGCVLRLMDNPDDKRWPVYAGLLMAFGQVIALEILPWLLLLSGWIGLWAIMQGKPAARQGLIYGIVLALRMM